jgi:hypothetical protein
MLLMRIYRYMQRFFENSGVEGIVFVVAVVVAVYSFWGASVLKAQQDGGAFTKAPSAALGTNL